MSWVPELLFCLVHKKLNIKNEEKKQLKWKLQQKRMAMEELIRKKAKKEKKLRQ
jgi:hypothetical protein